MTLQDIPRDERFKLRTPDPETVRRYADAMTAGDAFPEVTLARVDGQLYLVDGWTRLAAAECAGAGEIESEVRECADKADALEIAADSNARHGKPYSREDVDSACARIVAEIPDLSANTIAGMLHVSPHTVAKALERSGVMRDKVRGADGKQHPARKPRTARDVGAEAEREVAEKDARESADTDGGEDPRELAAVSRDRIECALNGIAELVEAIRDALPGADADTRKLALAGLAQLRARMMAMEGQA